MDFSSWHNVLSTITGLALVSLIGVGIRLVLLQSWQQRRERENRQVNERLRILIAAYKTLGGSFTGYLMTDPTHLRDVQSRTDVLSPDVRPSTDRTRRIRDAVEAALSDIVLLGTETQVKLAAHAATELVQGKPVETAALVISLRDFIREALDLDPVPRSVTIPRQGPSRPSANKKSDKDDAGGGKGGRGGGGGDGGGGGGGLGLGHGGHGGGHGSDDDDAHHAD